MKNEPGSKNNPFIVKAGKEAWMDKQKTIDILASWFIAVRKSPNDSARSLRLAAETAYYEITRQDRIERERTCQRLWNWDTGKRFQQSGMNQKLEQMKKQKIIDDLAEIKSILGLPDDTLEPLVGLIWRLQQRVEALEDWIRDG